MPVSPGYRGPEPRLAHGVLEFPVSHMRGGTSTGIVLYDRHLPEDPDLRAELIRHVMGVPQAGEAPGDRQITGLGRGIPQSCKVFIVGPSTRNDADIDSTLAQLAPGKAAIDWSVNCGNMSAALPFYADEVGLIDLAPGPGRVRIYNTNTGVVTHGLIDKPPPGRPFAAMAEIPGVLGRWPAVQLAMLAPAGAKTGRLLPTGNVIDVFNGVDASCVDLAVPMVILRAVDLGKTAAESPEALDADPEFKARLQQIWVAAGRKMQLQDSKGVPLTAAALAASETVPKACIVAAPSAVERAAGGNIRVRYFTPQAGHKSLAVTGGACLAAACLIPGTVAAGLVEGVAPLGADIAAHPVKMANPAGLLKATIEGARTPDGGVDIPSASYERSAQVLLRGYTPIYNASARLIACYETAARRAS